MLTLHWYPTKRRLPCGGAASRPRTAGSSKRPGMLISTHFNWARELASLPAILRGHSIRIAFWYASKPIRF